MDSDKEEKINQNLIQNEYVNKSTENLNVNQLSSIQHFHKTHKKRHLHHNHPPLSIIKRDISPIKPLPSNTVLPIPSYPYGCSTATVNVNVQCPGSVTTAEKKKSVKKIPRPKSLTKIAIVSETEIQVENSTPARSTTSVEVIREIPLEIIPITQVRETEPRPKRKKNKSRANSRVQSQISVSLTSQPMGHSSNISVSVLVISSETGAGTRKRRRKVFRRDPYFLRSVCRHAANPSDTCLLDFYFSDYWPNITHYYGENFGMYGSRNG